MNKSHCFIVTGNKYLCSSSPSVSDRSSGRMRYMSLSSSLFLLPRCRSGVSQLKDTGQEDLNVTQQLVVTRGKFTYGCREEAATTMILEEYLLLLRCSNKITSQAAGNCCTVGLVGLGGAKGGGSSATTPSEHHVHEKQMLGFLLPCIHTRDRFSRGPV